jgi:predicted Abi (CAAX) family protease
MLAQSLVLLDLLKVRFLTALTTWPLPVDWLWGVAIVAGFGAIALLIGLSTHFLGFEIAATTMGNKLRLGFGLLVTSVLAEEILFRVAFLPYAGEGLASAQVWLWGIVGILAFMLYHVLIAATIYRVAWPTFTNPIFQILAGGLGISCAIAYLISGSLWLAIVIHWLADVAWLFFLGGYKLVIQPIAFIHKN